jgi:polar amino acid transport system permease protein
MTEIFRAGILSVSHGQAEAADALGMTYRQKMRRVVLPEALRVVIPPTGNEFIAMMKDTALISVLGQTIGRMELFRRAQLLGNADVKYLEALVSAAAMYWALTAIFSFFQARLERRLSRGYIRGSAAPSKDRIRPAPGRPAPAAGHPHAGPLDDPEVGVPTYPEDESPGAG